MLLITSLADVRIHAAPLDDQGTGTDPRIEAITVTSSLPISDTHPGDGVTKTVYFNNSSSGFVTATFDISGTPTLVFVSAAAFGRPMDIYVTPLAQPSFVITYAVTAIHTTRYVTYAATNTESVQTSIVINYVQDVTAPLVTVTAPTESSVATFTVSWEATDPAPGSGTVASYTVAYREDDGAWEPWLPSTALTELTFFSATLDHMYTFSVTVYDHVSNRGEGTAVTQVGRHYVYLPLVMSDWVWWYQFDVYEPNNKVSQAYPLTSTQTVYEAYIWDATDSDDYYAITPATTETVQITLSNIPAGADYDLYVYYKSGSQYPLVVKSNRTGNQSESVTFDPTIGRTYYIRVYPYSGSSSTQPYYLTVTYQ